MNGCRITRLLILIGFGWRSHRWSRWNVKWCQHVILPRSGKILRFNFETEFRSKFNRKTVGTRAKEIKRKAVTDDFTILGLGRWHQNSQFSVSGCYSDQLFDTIIYCSRPGCPTIQTLVQLLFYSFPNQGSKTLGWFRNWQYMYKSFFVTSVVCTSLHKWNTFITENL